MDFLNYLIDAYLIFLVPRFDTSLKVQARNPRKVYAIESTKAYRSDHYNFRSAGRNNIVNGL